MSKSDEERLLLSEPALTAFIVAEMRHFLTSKSNEPGKLTKWEMSDEERLDLKLVDDQGEIINDEYEKAKAGLTDMEAIDLLCNATQLTFYDGYTNEQGIMSALGSAILFFKEPLRGSPKLLAACEIVGLSDYAVAHHITDMYHHRCFRGTYTKTLAPSGEGEIAARLAVGLKETNSQNSEKERTSKNIKATRGADERDEGDECLMWSPTTPGVCLHWKSDEEAWRRKRFERVQMEGTRDPRRGGSGTTR
ncbi:unnamed protein product [Cylindrotheca closterium]|uniref:Uncharacterized protein n=1 Tax=Cylindrotheca closterium TaxID=2856 RepID=A0AAD2CQ94_9STRA|nr:unnamed protein product [Cylindrotheca closterium]